MKYEKISKRFLKGGIVFILTFTTLTATVLHSAGTVLAETSEKKNTEETGEQSAEFTKNEVVYGKLKSDGSADSLYIVNQFEVSKAGSIKDYGKYDKVENLTNFNQIESEGSSHTFTADKGNFYYQGTVKKGVLPWKISVEYELEGNKMSAQDLAGKSGSLKIHIKTSQNPQVNSVFYENYLMQISLTLDNDTCSNIRADGGTFAEAGKNKQISFSVMPKKDGDYFVETDVTDFEMDGISVAAIPFSMDVEFPDTSEMSSGLTDLSDGITSLDDGTKELYQGAVKLKNGMNSLNTGIQSFHDGVGTYANGVISLDQGIQKVQANITKLTSGASDLATGSKGIADGMSQLSGSGSSIVQGSQQLQTGISQTNDTLMSAGINPLDVAGDPSMQSLYQAVLAGYITDAQYQAIAAAVGTIGGVNAGYSQFETGLEQYAAGVTAAATGYTSFDQGVQSFATGMGSFGDGFTELAKGSSQLAGGAPDLSSGADQIEAGASQYTDGVTSFTDGVAKLSDGTGELADNTADMPEEMQKQIDDMTSEYKCEFTPVSFLSEENSNISLVQFILTTDEIKKTEKKTKEVVAQKENFQTRLEKLWNKVLK